MLECDKVLYLKPTACILILASVLFQKYLQYATVWTQAVPVRGGPLRLGHHPALPHGYLLLHQERGPCGGHPPQGGI